MTKVVMRRLLPMFKFRTSLIQASIAGMLSVGPMGLATAADISVCPSGCNHSTVQAGITAAVSGDRVVVGTPGRTVPEVYVTNIQMKTGVDLISEGDDSLTTYNDPFGKTFQTFQVMNRTKLTVLQGAGTAAIVRYMATDNADLDGFTIENIDATAPDYTALVFVGASSPTIQNNIIRDNLGPGHNGGIQVGGGGMAGAEPLIQNNIIHYVNGHGVGITDGGNPTITGNKIFTRAIVTDFAPGIGFMGAASATILNNEIFRSGRAAIGGVSIGAGEGGLTSNGGKPIIIRGNTIYYNSYAAVYLTNLDNNSDVTDIDIIIGGPNAADGNTLHHNFAGIRTYSTSSAGSFRTLTIENNNLDTSGVGGYIYRVQSLNILKNTFTNSQAACAIRTALVDDMVMRDNTIDGASYCGVRLFNAFFGGPQTVTIDHNTINGVGYAGIALDHENTTGTITNNTITNSGFGGMIISAAGTFDILNNEIAYSGRGGIHTGPGMDGGAWMPTIFRGNPGDLNLTIRNNSVHHNGSGDYGGGLDIRHASGVIENNLVYKNHFGGIRFGEWINAINFNTVVENGHSGTRGGGIVFDDLAGDINADPSGTPSNQIPIRNNVIVNNYNAGINAGTLDDSGASCDAWIGKRDFNLLVR
ncbi:right-handed parallel beta-helix repeat-containing protein, partial [Pseudomonadota bacterium]